MACAYLYNSTSITTNNKGICSASLFFEGKKNWLLMTKEVSRLYLIHLKKLSAAIHDFILIMVEPHAGDTTGTYIQ